MFALIVNDKVLIFDAIKEYGIYDVEKTKLDGFLKILKYDEVRKHYSTNYEVDLLKIELYTEFLHKICLKYLKDHHYL